MDFDNFQKQALEEQIKELSVIKHHEIQEELDKLQASFNSLKLQFSKLKREKLPSTFEQPQFYENVETVDTLSKGNSYLVVLNFVKITSEQIDANLENGIYKKLLTYVSEKGLEFNERNIGIIFYLI